MNHALLLRYSVDRLGIEERLAPIQASGLWFDVFQDPECPENGVPRWASVSFSAEYEPRVPFERHVQRVNDALRALGMADLFAPPESVYGSRAA